jgi:GNAT superfamily N-acetyltransferase
MDFMDDYTYSAHICLTQQDMEATASDVLVLMDGLGRNILYHLGNVELGKSIRIFLTDKDKKTVGGIVGDLFGGWVYISLLWIDECSRNKGLGSELLRRMESEAIHLGCSHVHLDTYSFEAKPFYEKAGYEVFAKLDDYPMGYCKYFLKKSIRRDY